MTTANTDPHLQPVVHTVRRSQWLLSVLILAGLAGGIVWARFVAFNVAADTDTCLYAIFGHQILHGQSLYTDLWDHKPPLIYLSYLATELMVGFGQQQFFTINIVTAILTMIAIYAAAVQLSGKTLAGIFAAALWALTCGDPRLSGTQPNGEVFMNVLFTTAFAIMLRRKGWGFTQAAVLGALFAAGSMYKHIVVPAAGILAIVHVAFPPPDISRRKAIQHVAVIAAIGIATWGLTALYFAAIGHFRMFVLAVVEFNMKYVHEHERGVLENLPQIFLQIPGSTEIFVYGAIITALCYRITEWKPFPRNRALLIAFCAASLLQVALPGHFFRHYYQLILPSFAIGVGVCCASLAPRWKFRTQLAVQLIVFGTVFALILPDELRTTAILLRGTSEGDYSGDEMFGRALGRALAPDQKFYEWGWHTGLYFYSQRMPPFGVIVAVAVFGSTSFYSEPWAVTQRKYVADRLVQCRPELFVLSRDCEWSFRHSPAVLDFLASDYSDQVIDCGVVVKFEIP